MLNRNSRRRLSVGAAALRSIGYGDRLSDKVAIAARLAIAGLFPIGILAQRLGRPLPDPSQFLGSYRVRSPAGTFECPPGPGPAFLAADSSYEPTLLSLISQVSEGTILDIGASVGFITVRAARHLGSRGDVLAFEPHPVRFQYLERNLQLNDLQNVAAFQCALGDHSGVAVLHDVDPRWGPRPIDATMMVETGGRSYEVPVRTVDEVLAEHPRPKIRLVKIDVEGYEPQVLGGMTNTLRQRPPIVFEALNANALEAVSQCLPAGYAVRELETHIYLATSPSSNSTAAAGH